MAQQMSAFLAMASRQAAPPSAKIDAPIDWRAFSPILQRDLGWRGGPQGYDPLVQFKVSGV